jgi:hypothetical protein
MPTVVCERAHRSAANFRDLTGQRFGKRIVISRAPTPIYRGRRGSSMWNVKCDCGREGTIATSAIKNSTSCGCDESYTKRSGISRRSLVPRKTRANHGHRQRTFGLSPESFEEMKKAQDDSCAVCEKTFERTPHVDHNHACCPGIKSCGNCIRGLLCHHCNAGLGNFKDDYELLLRAVEYLRKHELER